MACAITEGAKLPSSCYTIRQLMAVICRGGKGERQRRRKRKMSKTCINMRRCHSLLKICVSVYGQRFLHGARSSLYDHVLKGYSFKPEIDMRAVCEETDKVIANVENRKGDLRADDVREIVSVCMSTALSDKKNHADLYPTRGLHVKPSPQLFDWAGVFRGKGNWVNF